MGFSQSLRFTLASLILASTATAQLTDADVEARIREGVLRFERQDLNGARSIFEAVLAERPDHVVAIYELAFTHRFLGDAERALAILDDAFARDLPVTAEFYALSASIIESLGRVDEAVQRFEQGVAAFPDNHNLRLNFALTEMMRDNIAGAKAGFERAITLNPNHPTAHFYLGQLYAGEGLVAAGILALTKGIGVDTVARRRDAAVSIIKRLMDSSVGLSDGVPIVVMPVDYMIPPMTVSKFNAAVGMHYATGYVLQKKTEGGDFTYEPYATALQLLISEFVNAGIDPASHFAAGYYQAFFSEIVEGEVLAAYAHLALAPLNPALASAWTVENGERYEAYLTWARSRPPIPPPPPGTVQ